MASLIGVDDEVLLRRLVGDQLLTLLQAKRANILRF
jgi:hypothetical protein